MTSGKPNQRTSSRPSSKRQQFKEQRKKKQQQQRLFALVAVVIGVVIFGFLFIVPQIQAANAPVGAIVPITPNPRPDAKGTSMGNPNAPVKIDVYEDFQCPICKEYSTQVEPQIVETYIKTGKVYYTFHNWPFIDDSVTTKDSHQAAEASMCAAAQGRFWDYHDMLFANQNGENTGDYTSKRLKAFAQKLGLDTNQFNTCYDNNQYQTQINQSLAQGQALGVSGTPSVFVNGKEVKPGYAPTFDDVRAAVEAALANPATPTPTK